MRYRNAISYAILLVIAYDIKDIANAIKKISHEISLRYRNDAISHAISHLSRIQMFIEVVESERRSGVSYATASDCMEETLCYSSCSDGPYMASASHEHNRYLRPTQTVGRRSS